MGIHFQDQCYAASCRYRDRTVITVLMGEPKPFWRKSYQAGVLFTRTEPPPRWLKKECSKSRRWALILVLLPELLFQAKIDERKPN